MLCSSNHLQLGYDDLLGLVHQEIDYLSNLFFSKVRESFSLMSDYCSEDIKTHCGMDLEISSLHIEFPLIIISSEVKVEELLILLCLLEELLLLPRCFLTLLLLLLPYLLASLILHIVPAHSAPFLSSKRNY